MIQDQASEVVVYTSASQLAAIYRSEMDQIMAAIQSMGSAIDRLRDAFMAGGARWVHGFELKVQHKTRDYHASAEGARAIELKIRHEAWACLVDKLDVKKLMSASDRRQLEEQLEGRDRAEPLPEITPDAILQVLGDLVGRANELMERKIREEYEFWKPHRRDYATDNPNRLGEKVIQSYMVEKRGGLYNQNWAVSHSQEGHIQALDHIFHSLDGRGIPEAHDGSLMAAIRGAGPDGRCETPYFRCRCFANRNLHLRFLRLDLLAEFNRVAAGGVLPDGKKQRRGTTAV